MTTLPAALAPWAPWLSSLAPEMVPEVGSLIRRLDAWVGALARPERDPLGAPAGYDGVDRRGPWHRLSLSEWALADEVPDEFLRRAVSRELSFVAMAHEGGKPERHIRLVIDVGPTMLGQPRLVALALLIVLARHAAKATFSWGPIQGAWRREGVDAAGLDAMLGSRSATFGSAGTLRREDLTADELWIVGPPGLEAPTARARVVRISVEEVPEAVIVRAKGTEVRLPLVEEAAGRRLLTEPWGGPKRRPAPAGEQWREIPTDIGLPTMLQAIPGTFRVIGWTEDAGGVALRLPRHTGDPVPKPMLIYPHGGRLVAGGWRRGGPVRLTQDEQGRTRWIEGSMYDFVSPIPRLPTGCGTAERRGHRWYAQLSDGGLFTGQRLPTELVEVDAAAGVSCLWADGEKIGHIHRRAGDPTQITVNNGSQVQNAPMPHGQPFLSWKNWLGHVVVYEGTVRYVVRTTPVQWAGGWSHMGEVVSQAVYDPRGTPVSAEHLFDGRSIYRFDGTHVLTFPRAPTRCVVTADDKFAVILTELTMEAWSLETGEALTLRHLR